MFSKKVTDNRSKNTKRKITKETKEIVYERDNWKCVFCNHSTQDHFHHILWGLDSEYTEDRNDPDKLVLACSDCHTICHTKETKKYRELGKQYIKNYYVHNNPNQAFSSGQE